MLYHQNNSRDGFLNRKNIALAVLIGASAFALLYTPARSTVTEGVYMVATGVWGFGGATTNAWNSFATNFRDKERLIRENAMLSAELARVEAQVLDRNLLAEKVTKLEESLGRVRGDDRVVAEVVVDHGQSPYDTVVVDAGAEEGIILGNVVVYAGSGVIGEIIEVSSNSSKIKLFSSPGSERAVLVGPHYVPANALGRGMGNFEAKVPQDSLVAIGDTIVSTKGNLILGTISVVEEKPAEPFKRIFFRVPFNITEIHSVEIIVDKRS
ncbi:MAG: rod shape-determining protein MreC [Candidatus Pacebacteria bacterium]|jgi:cell shape-determining protein MreC|nr:rod shape-determining protein MreC [Candidatus Paceibacterota bacterium]